MLPPADDFYVQIQAEMTSLRKAAWIMMALMAAAWWACEIDVEQSAPEAAFQKVDWRRTAGGWQKIEDWTPPQPAFRPALHPAIVGVAQIIFTLTLLVAFQGPVSAVQEINRDARPAAPKWLIRRPLAGETLFDARSA